jgi:hypothetical protein
MSRPGPALVHQAVQLVQCSELLLKRSVSAPCLAKASRFVTPVQYEVEAVQVEQQQQQEAALAPRPAPMRSMGELSSFASLSRVLLISQPSNVFKNLAARRWPSAVGPICEFAGVWL